MFPSYVTSYQERPRERAMESCTVLLLVLRMTTLWLMEMNFSIVYTTSKLRWIIILLLITMDLLQL
jgi:hypothetical protein